MSKYKVLVTGASGFLGSAICEYLTGRDYEVFGLGRTKQCHTPNFIYADICNVTSQILDQVSPDIVIHCAAISDILTNNCTDRTAEFMRVNCEGTANLARVSAEIGVKRFIFLSSIKVNGESTSEGKPFTALDDPCPEDDYGKSKMAAETSLIAIAESSAMAFVIIRPPLIYGKGVKGNFAKLVKLTEMMIPIPFGGVKNKRSLIGLSNLTSLIFKCMEHKNAENQIFVACDGQDLSSPDLIKIIAKSLSIKPKIVNFPLPLLWFLAVVFRKQLTAKKVLSTLQVDNTKVTNAICWAPNTSVEDELKKMFQ